MGDILLTTLAQTRNAQLRVMVSIAVRFYAPIWGLQSGSDFDRTNLLRALFCNTVQPFIDSRLSMISII